MLAEGTGGETDSRYQRTVIGDQDPRMVEVPGLTDVGRRYATHFILSFLPFFAQSRR